MHQTGVELYSCAESECNMGNKGYISAKNSTHIGKIENEKLVDGGPKISALNFDNHLREKCEIPESKSVPYTKGCPEITPNGEGSCSSDVDDDFQLMDVVPASRDRNRETVCKILNWVSGIALDPCHPIVGSLPERSCWNSFGHEEIWKQVLFVRKKIFLKRRFESSAEQSSWQKYHRMHPCMYEDNIGPNYNLRDRVQCVRKPAPPVAGSHPSPASRIHSHCGINGNGEAETRNGKSYFEHPQEKCIPLGPRFQADVPDWAGPVSASSAAWYGTRVWPPANPRNDFIIEREPIGKGRQDTCGCQSPQSVECVRFHCRERKGRMKRELGAAYGLWRFDETGEEVKGRWTREEERKFKEIVRSNPSSHNKSFFDEFLKCFPSRKRTDVVNYYYNVFLMHRRAQQNRSSPNDINSDDDESEYEPVVSKGGAAEGCASPIILVKKQRKN